MFISEHHQFKKNSDDITYSEIYYIQTAQQDDLVTTCPGDTA